MRVFLLLFITLISISSGSSLNIGGAFSIDYFNNPNQNIASSPIQQRPVVFHFLDLGVFNIMSGIGITEANYTIDEDDLVTPVFNEMYSGFYTLEFDLFVYPGIKIDLTENLSIGMAAGGGVRLPVLTGTDEDLSSIYDVDDSMSWFYSDMRYVFWSGSIFISAKLPKSASTRFFGKVYYKDFLFRTDQWVIGTTVGLLWYIK